MSWITPKTNWIDGEYFNIGDYGRIKGNIEFLQSIYKGSQALESVTVATIPTVDFFNNIVKAIEQMGLDYGMYRYTINKRIWNAEELNRIERAIHNAYIALNTILYCTAGDNLSVGYAGEDIGLI